jgi:hypothetical protein
MSGPQGGAGGPETPPPPPAQRGGGAPGVSQRAAVEQPGPLADPRPFRAPDLAALGLAAAISAAVGGALTVMGQAPIAAALAKAATGLVLLGLVVVLNVLLRKEGLGGEGFTGAAGVLGATLVALSGAAATLEAARLELPVDPSDPGRALLQPLGRAGWLFLALWLARSGWALRKLVSPSGLVGWTSVASAAAVAGLALTELVQHVTGGAVLRGGSLALLPLAVWSAGVVAVSCFGRFVTPEAPSD